MIWLVQKNKLCTEEGAEERIMKRLFFEDFKTLFTGKDADRDGQMKRRVLMMAVAALNRSLLGLGTLFTLFLAGYLADFSSYCLRILFPNPGFAMRLVLLAFGIVIMCFSSALYYTAGMGVSVYDAVALTLSARKPVIAFRWWRISCDLICVLIGYQFGSSVGIGTIITALFMGPLIDFFRRAAAEPLLGAAPHAAPARQAA